MIDLDNQKEVQAADQLGMREHLLAFPEQCEKAIQIAEGIKLEIKLKKIKNIVVTGLGGSAIGGDLLRTYLASEIDLPIFVVRNYSLPQFVNSQTLVIASSYSGNTEETLSAYEEAVKKGKLVFSLTTGGKLAELARKYDTPIILLPPGLPPRAALGYSFFPMLLLLSRLSLIRERKVDLKETVQLLVRKREDLSPLRKTSRNPAKKLAHRLYGKLPIIYSADNLDAVSTRWRNQLNENAKVLAHSHVLPELNHNEIVGWQLPPTILSHTEVIFLRDKGDHPQIKLRMDLTRAILKREAQGVSEVWSEGTSLLSRIFSLIYLGDFVSFYLALLNRVDPTPVERIDYLKRKLEERRN